MKFACYIVVLVLFIQLNNKKECLINGYDDIDYLLSLNKEIREFDLAH